MSLSSSDGSNHLKGHHFEFVKKMERELKDNNGVLSTETVMAAALKVFLLYLYIDTAVSLVYKYFLFHWSTNTSLKVLCVSNPNPNQPESEPKPEPS